MPELRVGVLGDWARSARGNAWSDLLAEIGRSGVIPGTIRVSPLSVADFLIDPTNPGAGQVLKDLDVLIVNWDAANGDPEYGSHLALTWLAHRRPEILLWVRTGRVLIIEGQATLSVPCQAAYDALVGPGEVPVCGPEDPANPQRQRARLGGSCRKSREDLKERGFEDIHMLTNAAETGPTHDSLFPNPKFITGHIRATPWRHVLYRGWFRHRLPWKGDLPWISIIETSDRPRLRNQSTMKVAKVGDGAIFVSTMFLATTNQRELVTAMLRCAHGKTDHLPSRPRLAQFISAHGRKLLAVLAGLAASLILVRFDEPLRAVVAYVGSFTRPIDYDDSAGTIKGVMATSVTAAVLLAYALGAKARKAFASIWGY